MLLVPTTGHEAMRGPLRRINYDRKLTRPIKLADGARLKT